MIRLPRAALLALFLSLSAHSARAEWLLTPVPTEPAGRTVQLALTYLNVTGSPQMASPGEEVMLRLSIGGQPVDVKAAARPVDGAPSEPVAPGAFRRWTLTLAVPGEIAGSVLVEYAGAPTARTVLVVQRSQQPLLSGTGFNSEYGQVRVAPASASALAAVDPYAIEDDPMYFVVGGSDGTTAKFQVSVKYPIWRPWNVFVGYSQLSVWDLSEESKPFRDNNYRPSLFWYEPNVYSLPEWKLRLGLRAGVEHESNGRGGAQSRSINIGYVRPELRMQLDGERFIEFKPKIYNYVDKAENTDIGRYRGYVDWVLRYGSRRWLLGTTVRRGSAGGSAQIDFSWRPDTTWTRNPDEGFFLYSQVFAGHGETMLDYNVKRPAQLRVGIGVVR